MCTTFTLQNNDLYVGRNLDLFASFREKVVVTPRNFSLSFFNGTIMDSHYAFMGMATVMDGVPMYAEAMNEKGIVVSGLQFAGNAHYFEWEEGKDNVAPFEMVSWILSQCQNMQEVKVLVKKMNILNQAFKPEVPCSPLHWMICDASSCIVVESREDGLHVFDNPIGVMTNNPPFEFHQWNLNQYLNLTKEYPENRFSQNLQLKPFASGMGAMGLPGDASSPSRFVKAAFLKYNCNPGECEEDTIQQCFRILLQVSMLKGSIDDLSGNQDYTTYSCVMNATKGIYYYMTYESMSIVKLEMNHLNLNQNELICYTLNKRKEFLRGN